MNICDKCKEIVKDKDLGCAVGTDCHVHQDCLCNSCDTGQYCQKHCGCMICLSCGKNCEEDINFCGCCCEVYCIEHMIEQMGVKFCPNCFG